MKTQMRTFSQRPNCTVAITKDDTLLNRERSDHLPKPLISPSGNRTMPSAPLKHPAALQGNDEKGVTSVVSIDGINIDMEAIENEISELYVQIKSVSATLKRTQAEVKTTRALLAERLYYLHEALASPGRGGKWTQRLKQMGVPHTTGDRLVAHHKTLLAPTRNQPTGLVSETTAGEIIALVKRMNPMLKAKLTSSVAIEWFVDEVRRVYMPSNDKDFGMLFAE